MTSHYLDRIPLDFSDPAVKELRSLLSDNYFHSAEVVALVRQAGVTPASINWAQPMSLVWDDVLSTLQKQGKLRGMLQDLIGGPDRAVAARLRELTADPPVTAAPAPAVHGVQVPPARRESLVTDDGAESTLLDVAFLYRGVELASAVARLLVAHDEQMFYGTAFRISPDLLLTNHHVLFAESGSRATSVEAWFGYERSFDGELRSPSSVAGRADTIVGDRAHNWAVVRLAKPAPAGAAVISLTGAGPVKVDDRVYIIQHPYGGVKKIGMIHNVVRYVDDDVVRYTTGTQAGSSGSPVFNEQWQLVALHERWLKDTTVASGRIKQGRRIERVADGLRTAGIE